MKDIILASKSPRRRDLLNKYGVDFQVVTREVEEFEYNREYPEEYAMSLAFQKAYEVAQEKEKSIVIASDTIVSYNGEILEKPKDRKDAYEMLKKLSGQRHAVITGLSVINLEDSIKLVEYEKSWVYFKKIDEDTIKSYIASGEVFGKAGSYAIQGLGGLLVEKIDGSYDNIVGLPVNKLESLLKKYFDIKLI